jgi:tetratricopeptide (TPR) repeat protein
MKMTLSRLASCVFVFVLLVGCTTGGGTRIDNIPMYGQPDLERPEILKKADEDFIKKAASGFGSREEASKAWYTQGDRFLREGNLDYGMRRYNQSWLLNPNNYQPYWGFARVMLELDKVDEAIKYLEKAEALINDPYQEVALLADIGSAYTYKGKQTPSFFTKANEKFEESVELDATYPNSWRRWAFSLYEQGDYHGAWEKVNKAEALNARPFPASFIANLEDKLPRPN